MTISLEPCVDSNGSPITYYHLYLKELQSGSSVLVKTFTNEETLEHTLTVADDSLTAG